MPGVMTPNGQPIWTSAVSPRSMPKPLPSRSVKVGVGTTVLPAPSTGSVQLIAAASCEDLVLVLGLERPRPPVAPQAAGLLAAKLAAIRAMFWRLM